MPGREPASPRRRAADRARRATDPPRGRTWGLAIGAAALLAAIVAIAVSVAGGQTEERPVVRDPASVAAGAQLYADNCAVCHGTDLRGTNTGPPFLNVIYAPNHHGDEAFQRAVVDGVVPHHWNFGTMAPVPGLTRQDVALIVQYVRSEQEAAGIFRDPAHP